jgi:sialic acid synthase SpsE
MSQIILDFSSGNTCRNDINIVKRMIDELKAVDTGKHEVIIKWQLFKDAGDNIPLDQKVFTLARGYAWINGYKTTASVFDKLSLDFLLGFDVPFVKIANRRDLDWLIGEVPRKIRVYQSLGKNDAWNWQHASGANIQFLVCVSEYPAKVEDYEIFFRPALNGISDHTTDFQLWNKYHPEVIEWHYVLEHDSNNLDAGPFARTPEQLRGIL